MANPVHPDLRSLRIWIDRMLQDYARSQFAALPAAEIASILEDLRAAAYGNATSASRGMVRALMASGVLRYQQSAAPATSRALPEILILDFIADALWPIVIAAELPMDWERQLTAVTSREIAVLVRRARRAIADGVTLSRQEFELALSNRAFVGGVWNLLEDFNDPRRGATYLSSIALVAGTGELPPVGRTLRPLAKWIFGAAAGAATAAITGVIGNRSDSAFLEFWDWLTKRLEEQPHPGPTLAPVASDVIFLQGRSHRQGAEDFFHFLLR